MLVLHLRPLLGRNLGAELLRPARLRFAPRLGGLLDGDRRRRRPSPRPVVAPPLKSSELDPPQNMKISAIGAERRSTPAIAAVQAITNTLQHPSS